MSEPCQSLSAVNLINQRIAKVEGYSKFIFVISVIKCTVYNCVAIVYELHTLSISIPKVVRWVGVVPASETLVILKQSPLGNRSFQANIFYLMTLPQVF